MNVNEIYKKAIEIYGEREQSAMAMEECGELIRAVNKMHRDPNIKNRIEIICEIADVQIMIEQLIILYDLNPVDIQRMINAKTERLKKRLEEHEQSSLH